eukprot:gene12235-25701_t
MVDYLSSITSDTVTTVIGGGDTVHAMLSGKTLPGIVALMGGK